MEKCSEDTAESRLVVKEEKEKMPFRMRKIDISRGFWKASCYLDFLI